MNHPLKPTPYHRFHGRISTSMGNDTEHPGTGCPGRIVGRKKSTTCFPAGPFPCRASKPGFYPRVLFQSSRRAAGRCVSNSPVRLNDGSRNRSCPTFALVKPREDPLQSPDTRGRQMFSCWWRSPRVRLPFDRKAEADRLRAVPGSRSTGSSISKQSSRGNRTGVRLPLIGEYSRARAATKKWRYDHGRGVSRTQIAVADLF